MLVHHALPRGLVAVLEMQPLAVWSVAEDDRVASLLDGPENVSAQHEAVLELDRHVPVDAHAVSDLAHLAIAHETSSRFCRSWPATRRCRHHRLPGDPGSIGGEIAGATPGDDGRKPIGMLTGRQRSSW